MCLKQQRGPHVTKVPSYHRSGCLAGWERHPPKGPSVGRPAATQRPASLTWSYKPPPTITGKQRNISSINQTKQIMSISNILPTLCGWCLAQFSSLAKTPSLHSMIQCSWMGKDSILVAAMAMPKPISRTRPPTRQKCQQFCWVIWATRYEGGFSYSQEPFFEHFPLFDGDGRREERGNVP